METVISPNTFSPSSGVRETATIEDVAQALGVSRTTVSKAFTGYGRMSPKTRETVLRMAQELGYEPNVHAQRLVNGHCRNTIGLFSLWFDFGVGTQKIQYIQSTLNKRGFEVPIYGAGLLDPRDEEAQVAAITQIRRQKPLALVCSVAGLRPRALEELKRYQGEGRVLVCYDAPVDVDCDQVLFDREDNTYQATRHLLELGHRRIGYGDHGEPDAAQSRVRGYQKALREFGVEPRSDWICFARHRRDYTQGGLALAKQYLALAERPTAMCIVNDYAAMVFMAEVQRAGLSCPGDVSIVGHDDHDISRYYPIPLSTVTHPSETIAGHVADFLFSRLDETYRGPSRQIVIRGELRSRQSAQPPESTT